MSWRTCAERVHVVRNGTEQGSRRLHSCGGLEVERSLDMFWMSVVWEGGNFETMKEYRKWSLVA